MLPSWLAGLPWWCRSPLIVGGTLMGWFSGDFPQALRPYGLAVAIAIALFGILASLFHYVRTWNKRRVHAGAKPVDWTAVLIYGGLLGIVACACAVGGGIWLQRKALEPPKPTVILQPAPAPVASPIKLPLKLEASEPPNLPKDAAELGARYLLLESLIHRARMARDDAAKAGPIMRDRMKPQEKVNGSMGMAGNIAYAQKVVGWPNALKALPAINSAAYKNRPIDLSTVPELSISTMTAPGEDAFSSDDPKTQMEKYNYRAFHFLIGNVLKQADALILDMTKERDAVKSAWEKTAEGHAFLEVSR